MEAKTFTVIVLEPSSSENWLTQSSEVTERSFSKKIYLGADDKSENWKEITNIEYLTLKVQIDKEAADGQKY